MAHCTQCGVIYHKDDMLTTPHVCDSADIPAKGEKRRPQVIGDDLIVKSPDGTEWKVSVSDAGATTTTKKS